MKTPRTFRTALSVSAFVATAVFATGAFAESPTCGGARDDSWMQPEAAQERIETLGYTIEGLSVSEGNCYALTGMNVTGESVTTYLDPRTGDIVQEDIAQ